VPLRAQGRSGPPLTLSAGLARPHRIGFADRVCTINLMTTIGPEPGPSPQVRQVLGAYLDASLLTDGFQAELWREAHLTLPQLAVLRSLRDGGPQTAGRLGETAGLSAASATRLFDRLEERGLVRRHRGHDDRRCVEIHLTARGRQMVGAVRALRNSPLRRAVEAMSEGEQRALATALRRLAEQARRLKRLSPRIALS